MTGWHGMRREKEKVNNEGRGREGGRKERIQKYHGGLRLISISVIQEAPVSDVAGQASVIKNTLAAPTARTCALQITEESIDVEELVQSSRKLHPYIVLTTTLSSQ